MNDDLISRKELRKAVKESGYFTGPYLHWARLLIDQAPTVLHDNYSMGYQDGVKKVISEKPQGEWIDTGYMEEYWAEEYQCSICGAKDHWHNYCPNCGAKMEGNEPY